MKRTSSKAVCTALLFIGVTSCRQQMSNEPRYRTYQESSFFPDGTSARPLPYGTIPVEKKGGELLLHGTIDGQPATMFPFAITLETLKRGQQRFNIYCTPCHDHLGTGLGMAVLRGFRHPPPSFHIDRLRQAPPGYFFDVITNGFGAMPSYATQIPANDRWTIIAYVKALQLSRNATLSTVPEDARQTLEAEKQ